MGIGWRAGSRCLAFWGAIGTLSGLGCGLDAQGTAPSVDGGGNDVTAPDSAVEDGSAQDGSAQEGSAQDGATPDGGRPDEGTPDGTAPDDGGCPSATHMCVPPTPPGWQAAEAVFEAMATPLPAPPPCDPGYQLVFDGYAGLTAPAATCGCTCSSPVNVCSLQATIYSDNSCNMACGAAVTLTAGICVPTGALCGSHFMVSSGPSPGGGSCAPMLAKTVPPAQWGSEVRLCAATASTPGGCPPGEQCVASSGGGFATSVCVLRPGTGFPCPSPFVNMRTFYASVADSRDCRACTCGAVTGATCTSAAGDAITRYSDGSCGTPDYSFTIPTGCHQHDGSLRLNAAASGGSCAPAAGSPVGGAAPDQPTTICCE